MKTGSTSSIGKGMAPFSIHKRPVSKKKGLKKRLGKSGVKLVFETQFG
jgi:hypothetical protein